MLSLRSMYIRALLLLMLIVAGPLALTTSAQEQTTADQTIDGVKVGKGVTRIFLLESKKFAEAMIRNYKRYLELNEIVKRRKLKREVLNEEEIEIDAIKTYDQLNDWIARQKRNEGYQITPGAHTDVFNKVQNDTPTPKTPDEEFEFELSFKVHEQSHVDGNLKRAARAGLTWTEVVEISRLIAKHDATPEAITDEEDEYFGERRSRWLILIEFCNDPVESALEEIQEYEAENRVRDKVLKTLPSPRRRRFE